jgi:2-amino-4-hydroxy-6-hydroxymethyldihydropteridine diphosphokinase
MAPRPTVVALGSNLGDRDAHLRYGVARVRDVLTDLSASPFLETGPEGVPAQPQFLNAVVVGRASAEPAALLDALMSIERARGRTRPFPGAPRTLDLDLILVGDVVITTPELTLPHPRFRERRFVLEPLAALAPDLGDPVTGLTMQELLARRPRAGAGSLGSRR